MARWVAWLIGALVVFCVSVMATHHFALPIAKYSASNTAPDAPVGSWAAFDMLPVFLLYFFVQITGFATMVALTEFRRTGRIGADWLRDHRRYVAVVVITAAAIVTPPDVVSQLAVAIPTYLTFEALIAWVALGEIRQG